MHLSITTKEEAIRVDQFFQSYQKFKMSHSRIKLDTSYNLLVKSRKQTHTSKEWALPAHFPQKH